MFFSPKLRQVTRQVFLRYELRTGKHYRLTRQKTGPETDFPVLKPVRDSVICLISYNPVEQGLICLKFACEKSLSSNLSRFISEEPVHEPVFYRRFSESVYQNRKFIFFSYQISSLVTIFIRLVDIVSSKNFIDVLFGAPFHSQSDFCHFSFYFRIPFQLNAFFVDSGSGRSCNSPIILVKV